MSNFSMSQRQQASTHDRLVCTISARLPSVGELLDVGRRNGMAGSVRAATCSVFLPQLCLLVRTEPRLQSELVFGYQLDGEWVADFHGLPPTLPPNRVKTVLNKVRQCNIAVTKYGAANYANSDGTPAPVKGYGTYSYFPP
jgi:hypothetical protein